MNTKAVWKNAMQFDMVSGECHVAIDAKSPVGKGQGFTPKELVLAGIAGCTAMDVIALLRKTKQDVQSFEVECDATPTSSGHPVTFQEVNVIFRLKGTIDSSKLLDAVTLSQTQYCGVSAMMSKAVPINYSVFLNGENIGTGQAQFK